MLVQLAQQHGVHHNQTTWKNLLLAKVAVMFGGEPRPTEPTIDLKVLHADVGQRALENDFLDGALIEAGVLSAKR